VELRLDASGKPDLTGAPTKMSTFDKNAVEESIRLKEPSSGSVTIITVGRSDAKKTVKEALAMGGDRGCLVVAEPDPHDSLTTAYLLARAVEKFGPFDLLLCAEGSSDVYAGQVGPMLSEWLALPFLGYVRKVEIKGRVIRCEQTLEERVRVLEADLPALVSVVSEINEPRYPTLLQIMQASKKPIEEVRSELLIDGRAPPRLVTTVGMTAQAMSRKRVIFEGSPEVASRKLVEALRAEGVVKR
jgi:electron transfer flavoprotein beta subunit